MAVADTDKTLAFYRDALKMPVDVGAFSEDPLADLMGLKGAQVRVTNAKIPGSALRMEFVEVKGAERTPMTADLNDPGAVRFTLRVKDIDSAIRAALAAGGTMVSTGGATVTLGGGNRYIVIRDPDNLFVQFAQSPPPAK
jgi:catechol 2,3-dioxygenase-like lactoylglutathione lyase family enzyme